MDAPPRRYFDNAATTFPKPPGVTRAVCDYLETIGVSPGRGSYRETVEAGRMLEACRNAVRELFNCKPTDAAVFALNGTDALNLAIKGVVRPGSHVITTCMDHNSVLRPLHTLEQRQNVRLTIVSADPQTTFVDSQDIARAITPQTALVVVNHASNVTGVIQPIAEIAALCQQRGAPLLVDAAQTAGHLPIDFSHLPIDLLACSGHKGLLGPLGTGVLVIRAGFEKRMMSVREGGTGSQSEQPTQPDFAPDKFESGCPNAVGLAGLLASLRWLLARGVASLHEHERTLSARFIERLGECEAENPGFRWFGPRDAQRRMGVFSVRVEGLDPEELSALLETQFGLLTRSGLHCAPLAHQTLGTRAAGGTTRLSFGPFTTLQDVDFAADALRQIARSAQPAL